MTPKEKADKLYNDAYMRWCYELSHDKNHCTAKDICKYMCDEILYVLENGLYDTNVRGEEFEGEFDMVEYYNRVKQEIQNL